MSQRRSQRAEESNFNIDDSVKECVRYIYSRESCKIPIKRAELMKHLNTVTQTPNNQFNSVITAAKTALRQVYHYKLIQVETKNGIQYIVVSDKEYPHCPKPTAVDESHRKILVAALTHIYMTGAPVREEDMYNFLQEAGLDEGDQTTKKLLTTTFTKQLYLSYIKIDEGESSKFVFQWGTRAKEELPKIFLLNKMANAMQKPVDHWCEQYREAMENAQ